MLFKCPPLLRWVQWILVTQLMNIFSNKSCGKLAMLCVMFCRRSQIVYDLFVLVDVKLKKKIQGWKMARQCQQVHITISWNYPSKDLRCNNSIGFVLRVGWSVGFLKENSQYLSVATTNITLPSFCVTLLWQ